MDDKEYAATKARVMAVLERWRYPLGVNMWRVHLEWNRFDRRVDADSRVAAETTADWRYMEATIEWFVPVLADMDDETLEYVVLHELTHVVVHELRMNGAMEDGADHEERVVTCLAKSLQWVRDHARDGDLTQPAPAELLREADVYLGLEAA